MCVILNLKPNVKKETYFAYARKSNYFLNQVPSKLVDSLINFDKEKRITNRVIQELKG
jgi:hypothetical protein